MTTKRISTEFSGDNAILAEVLFTSLGLTGNESKRDSDKLFCELSLLAVEYVSNEYKEKSGVKYPSHTQLSQFLKEKGI